MEKLLFNPATLTLLREAEGLTRGAFASLAGVTTGKLRQFEEGLALPTSDLLEAWAKRWSVDRGFFNCAKFSQSASVSFFRKTSAVPVKAATCFNAKMNLIRLQTLQRVGSRKLKTGLPLPHFPVVKEEEAELAAQRLRVAWGIGKGPVGPLVKMVESSGCLVESFNFGTDKIDALSMGGGTPHPFIFLNESFPTDRIRLSLAHEVGHLVMHRELKESVEAEAWAFAAEFLMPKDEIASDFYPLSIDSLARLKLKWKVSMQALLKRASQIGCVQQRYAQFLWMRLGQYGYRKCEPNSELLPKELPTPLAERINEFR